MKQIKTWNLAIAVVVMAMLAASVTTSCSSKESPTAPSTGGSNPGGGTPGPSGNFVVTVTASPSVLNITTTAVPSSLLTITVRSTSGSAPPNGSIAVVTISPSSAGTLDGPLCDNAVPGRYCLPVTNGTARASFTPTTTFAGNVFVTASFSDGSAQTVITVNGPVQVTPTPTPEPTPVPGTFHIDSISPNVGDPAGGQHATITGANIENPVKVDFNGTSAQVLSVTPTSITIVVPPLLGGLAPGETRAVNVTVTNAFGQFNQASDTLTNAFVYSNGGSTATPQVLSVTPTTGPQTGNTPITITGSNFQAPVQVIFDMGVVQLEAPVDNVTPSKIVAHTPDITQYVANQTLVTPVDATIKVINLNTGFSAIANQHFFYGQTIRITSVSPSSGTYQGGDLLTIFGSGFDEPVSVCFFGNVNPNETCVAQQVISVAGDQIVIRTNAVIGGAAANCGGRAQVSVRVTNVEGGATANSTGPLFTFIGPPNPLLTGINPSAGAVGSQTTISGSNLPASGNTRVLFGGSDGSSAQIVSQNTNSITVKVPAAPPGFSFNFQTCTTTLGTGTQLLPTPISVTVRNLATGCEGTLPNAFTLDPPIAGCQVTTPFPTPTPALPQCSDGIDNDNDGFTDFGGPGGDPQCSSSGDNSEGS